MKKVLFTFFFAIAMLCVSAQTIPQRMQNKTAVSVVLDDVNFYNFNNFPGVNFFIGEFMEYIKSLKIDCNVNWTFPDVDKCSQYDFAYISFNCHQWLKKNGCWYYDYSNIEITLSSACQNNDFVTYKMDNFTSPTTLGSLKQIFKKKFSVLNAYYKR